MMASPRLLAIASSSVSNRRIWIVQVTLISSQSCRARSTLKPAGLPSGPVKLNGGKSDSATNAIPAKGDVFGLAGRRLWAHQTRNSGAAASTPGLARLLVQAGPPHAGHA